MVARSLGLLIAVVSGAHAFTGATRSIEAPIPVASQPPESQVDLNGDGKGDAFLYNEVTGYWSRQLSQASGGFVEENSGTWSPGWSVQAADFDGNALTDLFLFNSATGGWAKMLNDAGTKSFTMQSSGVWWKGWQRFVMDLNGDGLSDLFLFDRFSGQWYECLSVPTGFTYSSGGWSPVWEITALKLNGDALGDLFLIDRTTGRWLWALGQAGGGFTYPQEGNWATDWALYPGDFNADGVSDLFLYRQSAGAYYVALNTGAGFTYVPGAGWADGWTPWVVDLNADGRADLLLHNKASGQWQEHAGNGAGQFTPSGSGLWNPPPRWDLSPADFNGDGRTDFLLANAGTGNWVQALNQSLGSFVTTAGSWQAGAKVAVGSSISDPPGLITFDEFPVTPSNSTDLPYPYRGLVWSNFAVYNPSPGSALKPGTVSPTNVVINPYGEPAVISSDTPFTLKSAYLTAGSDLHIRVEGWRDSAKIYSNLYALRPTGPILVAFDYANVDRVTFTPEPRQLYAVFAMDNVLLVDAPATDADGDGVLDDQDTCSGTPPGTVVDTHGCRFIFRPASQVELNGDGNGDALLYSPASGHWSRQLGQFDKRFFSAGFLEESQGQWATGWSVLPADFDGDVLTDFFLFNPVTGAWSKMINDAATKSFIEQSKGSWWPGWKRFVMDMDGDGISDLFLYDPSSGQWFKCISTATGFTYAQGGWAPGWEITPMTLNNDQAGDMFLFSRTTGHWFWVLGQSGPNFTYPVSESWLPTWRLHRGDFNGDGLTDLLLHDPPFGTWFVAMNNALGTGFTYTTGRWPLDWAPLVADLTGDGKADVWLNNGTTLESLVMFGDGAGQFTPDTARNGFSRGSEVRTSDFNRDGRTDALFYWRGNGQWVQQRDYRLGTFDWIAGAWQPLLTVVVGSEVNAVDPEPSPDLITFDEFTPTQFPDVFPPDGYGGLQWSNFQVYNYTGPGLISAPNVAFTKYGTTTSSVSASTPFTLKSGHFISRFIDMQVTVVAWKGSSMSYSAVYVLTAGQPSFITFDYIDVDRVTFSSYSPVTSTPGFVMDNLLVLHSAQLNSSRSNSRKK